jgi:hypothetical protein
MATTTRPFSPLLSSVIAFSKALQLPVSESSVLANSDTFEQVLATWRAINALDEGCGKALEGELDDWITANYDWELVYFPVHEVVRVEGRFFRWEGPTDQSGRVVEMSQEEGLKRFQEQLAQEAEYWIEDILEKNAPYGLIEGVEERLVADSKYNALSRVMHYAITQGNKTLAERALAILRVCFPTNTGVLTALYTLVFVEGAVLNRRAPGFYDVLA